MWLTMCLVITSLPRGGSPIRESVAHIRLHATLQGASSIFLHHPGVSSHFSVDWTVMSLEKEAKRMMDGQVKTDTRCHGGGDFCKDG